MSWKTKKMPQEPKYNRNFISKTITGPTVAQIYPAMQQHHSNLHNLPTVRQAIEWTKEKLNAYTDGLRKQGYEVGTKVRTNYGREGVITGFIDENATSSVTHGIPNCIFLQFDGEPAVCRNPYLVFNINEINIIGEQK